MNILEYNRQLIFVIGAARSGTKLIRDLIASHPEVAKIPYDINYVWRLGNENISHDELSPEMLTPRIRKRILEYFERHSSGAPFLIEKTVSNCLRVPYVDTVFPESKFVHLVRQGYDVIESVYRQWTAPPDWRYIWKKARTFPLSQAPSYALSYAAGTLEKILVRDNNSHSTWGPRYKGIDEDIASREPLVVCAIQWARCVKKAMHDLNNLSESQVLTIHYEDFVCAPGNNLETVAQFAGLAPGHYRSLNLDVISQKNVGKGLRNLSVEQKALVMPYIKNALLLLGYGCS